MIVLYKCTGLQVKVYLRKTKKKQIVNTSLRIFFNSPNIFYLPLHYSIFIHSPLCYLFNI